MIAILRNFVKSIPTLILSFLLAVAVWISAVTANDPVEQSQFPRPLTIEQVNLNSNLIISNEVASQAQVTINAPSSIWNLMLSDRAPIRAWIDLAGLDPGEHTVPVRVQPLYEPANVVEQSPEQVTVVLEQLETREFGITLIRRGEPAIGFQTGDPTLNQTTVTISGPSSLVDRVSNVQATLDLTQASENINRVLNVQVLDVNGAPIEGLTVTPQQVNVSQPITQRGGYRNVVVKVETTGQVSVGYRLTNISVAPPNVTVFSSNPTLVDRLPGVIATSPLDLTGVRDDLEVRLPLNLPDGVEVVGDQTVVVQVGVAAIEGSVTLTGLQVDMTGLSEELVARLSPETVDVIISGPVPLLDNLTGNDVRVIVDLTNVTEGTYQFAPRVTISIDELQVESILPSSLEAVVELRSRVRRTPSPTPTRTPTPTPSPTPGQ